jgi:hypothetical protein
MRMTEVVLIKTTEGVQMMMEGVQMMTMAQE